MDTLATHECADPKRGVGGKATRDPGHAANIPSQGAPRGEKGFDVFTRTFGKHKAHTHRAENENDDDYPVDGMERVFVGHRNGEGLVSGFIALTSSNVYQTMCEQK